MYADQRATALTDIDVWTEGEEFSENNEEVSKVNMKSLQKVWEGPCREGMWIFLDPCDVVEMRTTASSWNTPSKYGPHGELFFFTIKKEPTFHGEMVDFGTDTVLDIKEYKEHNVGNLSLKVVEQGQAG